MNWIWITHNTYFSFVKRKIFGKNTLKGIKEIGCFWRIFSYINRIVNDIKIIIVSIFIDTGRQNLKGRSEGKWINISCLFPGIYKNCQGGDISVF